MLLRKSVFLFSNTTDTLIHLYELFIAAESEKYNQFYLMHEDVGCVLC